MLVEQWSNKNFGGSSRERRVYFGLEQNRSTMINDLNSIDVNPHLKENILMPLFDVIFCKLTSLKRTVLPTSEILSACSPVVVKAWLEEERHDYSLSSVSILQNLRHFSPYLTSNASNH